MRKSAGFGLETSTVMDIAVRVQAVLGDSHMYVLPAKGRQELMPPLLQHLRDLLCKRRSQG